MCDIEQSIAKWRQQMIDTGIKTPVPLEELESHLREEVDRQMREGISAERAFEAAVSRIGHADALRFEFDKLSPPGLSPRYLRLFCFLSAPLLAVVNLWTLQPGEISPMARFAGLATMSLVALYISGLPFLYRRLPSPRNRLVQIAMWMGWILGLVWPLVGIFSAVGMIHLSVGITTEMIIWTAGAAWFATLLAYWVSGQGDRTKSALPPSVCG
jgi:hypothetical protein